LKVDEECFAGGNFGRIFIYFLAVILFIFWLSFYFIFAISTVF